MYHHICQIYLQWIHFLLKGNTDCSKIAMLSHQTSGISQLSSNHIASCTEEIAHTICFLSGRQLYMYLESRQIMLDGDNGKQGSFCECAQPMNDDVILQHRLSLAGRILRMIPGEVYMKGPLAERKRCIYSMYGRPYETCICFCCSWQNAIKLANKINIRIQKYIQCIPLSHDLTLNNGKWVMLLIWWW